MNQSSICPFGPSLQKYWDKRYKYFSRFDEGVQIDAEGLYSVTPEQVALHQAKLINGKTVLDGFTGVGGNAIAFARTGKLVTTIDIDASRLAMAKHNATIYGVQDAITFIQGDFLKIAPTIRADTVYLDPPWGGPAYKKLPHFLLDHFNPDGNSLLELSLRYFGEIAIKLPTIFDMSELDRFSTQHTVYDDVSNGQTISKIAIIRN